MNYAVSVVMAVHNGKRFLAAQVDSVLAELESQDELVVVDDASTDGSFEWLRALRDRRIVLHRNEANLGVFSSFEKGLRKARNEIVFLSDQDDVWLPGKRAAFVAEFERDPGVLIVISDAELIDGDDTLIGKSFMATRGGFRGGAAQTLLRNRYLGCAMAMRRRLVHAALPIPASVPMHDMWFGALGTVLGKVQYIPRPLLRYRRHGKNLSPSTRQGWWRMLHWRVNLLVAVCGRLALVGCHIHNKPRSADVS